MSSRPLVLLRRTKVPELCCDTNVVVSLPKDSPLYYTITPTEAGTVTLSTCDAATNVDTVRNGSTTPLSI